MVYWPKSRSARVIYRKQASDCQQEISSHVKVLDSSKYLEKTWLRNNFIDVTLVGEGDTEQDKEKQNGVADL